MSVQHIIIHLNKLIALHDRLLQISKKKTEVLKDGKMDELRSLLTKEQKHVQAINQIEQKRVEAVVDWAKANKLDPSTITVSTIIEDYTEDEDQKALEEVTLTLVEQLMELRRQENLNQQLTQQSLQFVQLSLDLVQPSMKNINYGKSKQTSAQERPNRSVFDSRA